MQSSAVCRDLDLSSRREWLETNGIGGYASSSLSGINTRRYHGLLVAALRPPVGRMVLLSKFEETLFAEGREYRLSANRYPGTVYPEGFLLLKEFRLDPFPVFTYECDAYLLRKSIFMVPGENATVVEYELEGPAEAKLEIKPLIAFRDYHATTHENAALNPAVSVEVGLAGVAPYAGLPTLYLAHQAAEVRTEGCWYRNFEYDRDRERGFDDREDLYNPCTLTLRLDPGRAQTILASTSGRRTAPRPVSRQNLAARAAGQFVVSRGEHKTVIAGYHWFTDWGRDTMISLPGLTLRTGRAQDAADILRTFAGTVDQGMLPNRFPDGGEAPEYNTVDATLWFFEAARAWLESTGDLSFVRDTLYPVFGEIVRWHQRGTRFGIRVDEDGLVHAGEAGSQLTWMDAVVNGRPVTPRQGKPVEIQALWYNAMRFMEDVARRCGLPAGELYRQLAEKAAAAFNAKFWNEGAGCLYDVIDGEARDGSIRPNQIFAVSLGYGMLSRECAAMVLETVRKHLLTPFGLRTLAPSDPRYRGRYEGDPANRDNAYHQGTVWPWLMGPFLKAWNAVNGEPPAEWTAGLRAYFENEGVGQLPEVFDGDAPHRAGGCIAQAWSVAELMPYL